MTSRARRATLWALVVFVLTGVGAAGATTFPPGFGQDVIASGLNEPTAISFFPDGRIAIAEKSGVVRLVKGGALLPTPLIDISDRVNDYWDRGLLGIAVDPNFPTNPHVYLLYVFENDVLDYTGPKTARVTRVTVAGDTANPTTEITILGKTVGRTCKDFQPGTDCLPADGQSHSVGNVKFAPDGTLFLTLGDSSSFSVVDPDALRAQDLDSLSGKVMHITRTGQGLPTNPFWNGNANANRSKVWAYGVRNAYRFGLRPGSNIPYVGDVGWNTYEEINVVPPGANLGWPCYEGPEPQAGYSALSLCQALYAGAGTPVSLASLGTPVARVMTPAGSGGGLAVIKDQDKAPVGSAETLRQYDSWDGNDPASEDWVGYTFAESHTFARVVFQEGIQFFDGGWFNSLTVQVLQNGQWVGVSNLSSSPAYPGNNGVSFETFTLSFTPIAGTGIRIYGVPGGSAAFVSVGELEVFASASGGGGAPPGEALVTSQGTAFAKVPASLGAGASVSVIKDGDKPPVGTSDSTRQYDSWDGFNLASDDWVGYQFATPQTFTRLVFQEGIHFPDGGWFDTLTVQVRQNGQWVNVSGLTSTPPYPGNNGVSFETFTLAFTPIQGDAIRLYGAPGGSSEFISVGELDVYAQSGQTQPPPDPSVITMPLVSDEHIGASAAVTGGVFNTGTSYPPQYQGLYFYGDFSEGVLRTLRVDANDALVPGSVTLFANQADGPVDIEIGPDGLIYYVAISANEVRRVRYTLGNTPPVAVASGSPSAGLAPLSVQFSSAGSNDPDGDPVTYAWNFGDGTTGTGPSPQHTYQLPNGTRTATLTVQDSKGAVDTASVTITVGNRPPVPTITSPAATLTYKVGDVISYSGSASDPDQGSLPASALSWQIVTHHCPGGSCHTHPGLSGTGASGSFTVPDHGDDSYFEIILTAVDAGGLTGTVSRSIQPKTVQVTVTSVPVGNAVIYDGTSGTAPLVKTSVANSQHTIQVDSPQGGNTFQSWSDGGAQQHQVTLGTTNVTYTATFSGVATCPTGQYKAEYFNNVSLTGAPVLTRCETTINNNWGLGGPGNGIGTDNFSVRWTGRFTFTAGSSTFTTVSDDGVRLWVDNVAVINRWTDHAPTTDTATRTMTAGDHDIRLEFYEKAGGAVMQLSWTTPSGSSCPLGQYKAEYFNNLTLTGTPALTRCEAAINNNWGLGGPGSGIGTDNFSVRWTGRFTFAAGSRTFTTVSDDGVRLWVDNVAVIDRWTDHPPTTDTATRTMTAGDHDIKLEFYEKEGGAVIQLSW